MSCTICSSFREFPKAVFFIIGNEFCERFSYYGMRAVLMLYLTQYILMERSDAKVIFHAFTAVCYFMPVFGALLADIKLGKYRTILYLSLVYALGNILLSLSSMNPLRFPQLEFAIVSLMVIGVGSGGIKPCVAAFGGDQFTSTQTEARDKFFAIFYWSINAGAVISMFVTPLLRAEVQCFDGDCYPLAFGFPAILMIISTIIFVSGKRYYRMIPCGGSVILNFAKCSCHALLQKFKSNEKRDHWLQYADNRFDKTFINDVKSVWSMFFLFCPLPMFWALFDQQGSAWTMQSSQMDGRLGNIEILPDQMDSLNAFFVITFIPIFTFVIYPAFAKCHLLKRPLQRMATGGFLAAVAFALSGIIQLIMEKELPIEPSSGYTDIVFINTHPNISKIQLPNQNITIEGYEFSTVYSLPSGVINGTIYMNVNQGTSYEKKENFTLDTEGGQAYIFAYGLNHISFQSVQKTERRKRDPKGQPLLRIVYTTENPDGKFSIKSKSKHYSINETDAFGITEYIPVSKYEDHNICWNVGGSCIGVNGSFYAEKGGFYAVVYDGIEEKIVVHTIIKPDWMPIIWQIPQYVIMTAGEVMLSITGLAFAYSQAPASMKSVLQAAWLLTVAFGNIIVLIIEEIKKPIGVKKESISFFTYTIILAVDMVCFSIIAWFYKYVDNESSSDTKSPPEETQDEKL